MTLKYKKFNVIQKIEYDTILWYNDTTEWHHHESFQIATVCDKAEFSLLSLLIIKLFTRVMTFGRLKFYNRKTGEIIT